MLPVMVMSLDGAEPEELKSLPILGEALESKLTFETHLRPSVVG